MMRNDYRRKLILLRGNEAGYSGHVRLERRTMMGSMYFLVQSPADCPKLRAAMVGRNKNGYYACDIGVLQRDSRGQAAMNYSFDPRNICNHILEEYQLIVVSCEGDDSCAVMLWGNVCGHADINWERVRTALCGLYAGDIARQDAPKEEEAIPMQEARTEAIDDIRMDAGAEAEDAPGEIRANAAADKQETPPIAGEQLGIDMDVPWPQSIEPVRSLFLVSALMENPPDEEYTYIAAAMPPESGYACSAIGVRVQDGAPVSVRYGLPAAWSDEPPAGLEDYTWVGSQNRGWWMIQVDF